MSLREFLHNRYPGEFGPEDIVGSNYPPPWYAGYVLMGAQSIQWSAMALMFFGSNVLTMLGYPAGVEPNWFKELQQNKMGAFVGVFFMNSMAQSMTNTGAFEVEVDGKLAYSKLETGRMPNIAEIVRALEKVAGITMPEAIE